MVVVGVLCYQLCGGERGEWGMGSWQRPSD